MWNLNTIYEKKTTTKESKPTKSDIGKTCKRGPRTSTQIGAISCTLKIHHPTNSHGIMWLSSVAANNLDTITGPLVVAQPLSTTRCQSSNNVQSVHHPAATVNRQFVWPLPVLLPQRLPLLSLKTRSVVLWCFFIVVVLWCWPLATWNKNNESNNSSCLWWLGEQRKPTPRPSVCRCVENTLVTMVDPLKIFWVLTNSTYLGESSAGTFCLMEKSVEHY